MDGKIKKQIYVLIDPGKDNTATISKYIENINIAKPDKILIGGSQNHDELHSYVRTIKEHCDIPIYLFPGHSSQFTATADGILLISLLSGRNAEFIIGQHVRSSIEIAESGIDIIPTGYILIDGKTKSAVERVSQTKPIDCNDIDTIVRTALAAEHIGFKTVYLEAGSGALQPISGEIITAVRKRTKLPLIVGGGLCSVESIDNALNAGADIVVVGNYFESNIEKMKAFVEHVHNF